jgi:hypothetical protein
VVVMMEEVVMMDEVVVVEEQCHYYCFQLILRIEKTALYPAVWVVAASCRLVLLLLMKILPYYFEGGDAE